MDTPHDQPPSKPTTGLPATPDAPESDPLNWSLFSVATYPQQYLWFVFFASLDIMITWIVLHSGGLELNQLADRIIQRFGAAGAAGFKFSIVFLVILTCEMVGRRRHSTGLKLAEWSVAISVIPVAVGIIQLLVDLREWILGI